MKPVVIAGGVVLALGVGAVLVFRGEKSQEPANSATVERVATVTRGDLDMTVSADGVVEPINSVEIRSKASGEIKELTFEEGDAVKKGDLLIALDQTTTRNDYEQAKADLELAEANEKQQENNHRRSQELFDKKLLSEQELDAAYVELVRARSGVIKARAALSSADERLRDTRIRAPIAGIILTKNVEIGQIISSAVSNVSGGTLLATLADMNKVYVTTSVDEVDIGHVAVGQRATVVADAYPDEQFSGEVVRIAPLGKTEQTITTFSVIILVQNRRGLLKAGMSASVDIEVFKKEQILLVPSEAVKDPRSEQGRALLALMQQDSSSGGAASDSGAPGSLGQGMRERMQNASPEEREAMRQRFQERLAQMSPEERQRVMEMRQRWGGGGNPGPEGSRGSQVPLDMRARRRLVMVREGDKFVPRFIQVGVSNFDSAEVLQGLKEGDEVLTSTISRAMLSAQEFNERLRSRSSIGPASSGGRR